MKAIYTMLEGEIEDTYEHWNDKKFIEELHKRSVDLKSKKVAGVSWEEAQSNILNSIKRKKKSTEKI